MLFHEVSVFICAQKKNQSMNLSLLIEISSPKLYCVLCHNFPKPKVVYGSHVWYLKHM